MKKLELTPRLRAVADLVSPDAVLVDVGTDHAYLPVWLLLEKKISCAIASDLRVGPLERARLTAKEYDCRENIDFRLCDGLCAIRPEEVDSIVIAGMGGETIAAILEAAPWTRSSAYTLILQPMSAQNVLRRWLWQRDYDIKNEIIVREGNKLYTVFSVRYGAAKPMCLGEEWAGRQSRDLQQPLRGVYLSRLLDKTERAIQGISRGKGEQDRKRLEELIRIRESLLNMKKEWDTWQE